MGRRVKDEPEFAGELLKDRSSGLSGIAVDLGFAAGGIHRELRSVFSGAGLMSL